MAITITANLDASGVRAGASQVGEAVDGMAEKATQSGDALESMAAEARAEIAKLKSGVSALKGELDQMGSEAREAFNEVEGGAEDSSKAIDSNAERRDKIKTVAVAYLAVADAVKKATEFGKKLVEIVDMMAENGNPAAIELSESFGEVKASLLSIAEDPVFQDMLSSVANIIKENVIPAIKAIPDAWVGASDWLEDRIAGLGESLGVFAEGTREAMDDMQEADAQSREIRQKQMAADKEAKRLKEELAKTEEERAKKEKEAAKEAAEAAKEREREEKEYQREQERSAKELERLRKDQAAEEAKRRADELADFQRIQKAKLDAERKAIDERKRLVTGSDVDGAKGLIGAQSREQVRAAYAARQGKAAEEAAKKEGGDEDDIAKARKRATELAKRQFDKGQADPEEVRKTQVEFANATIDAGQKQGKVSAETAKALREGIQEMANVQNELDQVRDEISQLQKMTQGAVLQGQRRRAQVAGAGR